MRCSHFHWSYFFSTRLEHRSNVNHVSDPCMKCLNGCNALNDRKCFAIDPLICHGLSYTHATHSLCPPRHRFQFAFHDRNVIQIISCSWLPSKQPFLYEFVDKLFAILMNEWCSHTSVTSPWWAMQIKMCSFAPAVFRCLIAPRAIDAAQKTASTVKYFN